MLAHLLGLKNYLLMFHLQQLQRLSEWNHRYRIEGKQMLAFFLLV
jgi:hypothetical protein